MTMDEVYNYYGSWGKALRKLDFGSSTMQRWRQLGYIPIQTQYRIELVSKVPELKADINDCMQQFEQYL